MTYLSGIRVLRRGQDRLFDPLHKVLVILDGIGLGMAAALLGRIEPGDYSSATSGQFDILVKFPYLKPTESIARGQPMPEIAFAFQPNRPEPIAPGKTQTLVAGYGRYVIETITPVYVDFFEKNRRSLITKCGEKTCQWPPFFQFVRAIRNFISHSSGKVHFDYKNDPAVSWHHLRYSAKDEGRQVVGGDIDIAELIILLFEFGDALDREGCPPLL